MSYDNFSHTFSNSRKNHPWPELDAIIEDMKISDSTSILDIWCGNGRFLEEAQKQDLIPWKYLGIDNSTWMIEEAGSLHPDANFEVIWMGDLDRIGHQTFDAILFLASYHHLKTKEERIQVLKESKKLLNPNGRLYMTNWNLRDQERYQKCHRGHGDFDIKIGEFTRYYHGFTVDELDELFRETGWKTIKNEVFTGWRNLLSILRRVSS
jgi:tRNA (uracil-5-)-methyltransferase TRM9